MADIDAKHTRELTDAKATIDHLERSVIAGNQRLRVNALHGMIQHCVVKMAVKGVNQYIRILKYESAFKRNFCIRANVPFLYGAAINGPGKTHHRHISAQAWLPIFIGTSLKVSASSHKILDVK
ncbi:lysis system i-spanin subunit Rz [Erwiniaceae bacterium CAU 1747]